jgi:peptide-methionine (S)-S-oxide reductase
MVKLNWQSKFGVVAALSAVVGVSQFDGMPVPFAYAAEGVRIDPPALAISEKGLQTAIFAGGCFWGVEGVFDHVKGVTRAEAGYIGGSKANATYDLVSNGTTGHAEAVRVTYDPAQIGYNGLLHVFFAISHDPTQLNKQGPDTGTQYRTAIFPVTGLQGKSARAYITQLSAKNPWGGKIVTKIESGTFYPAETYHQNFMAKNPSHPYIRAHDAPKVAALRRIFPGSYK